jgi:hypothetical protein
VGFLINDQFQACVPGTSLNNATPVWYDLDGNGQLFAVGPVAPVAEPSMLALTSLALGLSGWVSARRRRKAAAARYR